MSERLKQREAIIEQIRRDDPKRPGTYIYLEDSDILFSYHGSGDENTPCDYFVFQESFSGNGLQPWQDDLITNTPHHDILGHASVASRKATWICSYHKRNTAEAMKSIKDYFGFPAYT
jgi:hypothetical protein